VILIEVRTDPNSAGSLVDVEALGIHDLKPSASYSHPMRLEFKVTAANHTLPFNLTDYLIAWDTEHDYESSSQDDTNPFFEGWVEEVDIGEGTNTVQVVAYDPTYRASKQSIVVMNTAWLVDSSGDPYPDPEGYPRAVFNVTNDNDDDYALSLLQNATLGQIFAQVLLDAQPALYALGCAPSVGNLPYLVSELGEQGSSDSDSDSVSDWEGGLDFKPQEKVVTQSETIRAFVQRVLSQYDPATKLIWQPGERIWRFIDVKASDAQTITVNDPDNASGMVLSMEMHRSSEGRYGAVKFYGPEGLEWAEAEWEDGGGSNTLEPYGTTTEGEAPNEYTCYNKFRIIDPAFTRIARKGPYQVYIPGPSTLWTNSSGTLQGELMTSLTQTWSPSFQVRYADAAWGSGNWKTLTGWRCDFRNGTIDFGNVCIARYKGPGSGNRVDEPIGFKFVYPRLTVPLTVRYPETGYEGTIHTVAGIENEIKCYDEALAVGKSYGLVVTTPRRLQRFGQMARQIHRYRKDLTYAGTIVLEGLHYDFLRLNQRINLAAKDDDGDPLTTGWEAINAILTDCEIDPEEFTTTLQFSSDQLELLGIDPEQSKRRLQIRQASQQFYFYTNVAFSYARERTELAGLSHLRQRMHVTVRSGSEWVDSMGGLQ